MKQFIHFQFEARQVASLKMEALLGAFDTKTMSDPGLRHYCGSVVIQFHNPDTAPHPVLNPELRKFMRVLAQRWGPHSAPFFSDTGGPFLLIYFAAQLDHLLVAAYGEDDAVLVRHRPDELEALRRIALQGILQLGHRAGLTTDQIQGRQGKISKLFSTAFTYPLYG